jgi:uncharacterized repeat protein (TIGR03847 family)
MSSSFDLEACERITVGAIGQPGQREFFLQAREGEVLISLKVEKGQVGALAERLGELLHDHPATSAIPEPADLDLEEPVLAEWAVGSIGLSFATDEDRVVLICEELVLGAADEDDEDDDDDPDDEEPRGAVARFACSRGQAAALAMRGAALLATGRPSCPLCGYPLDPRGHVCPKTNGHRPPRL